MPKEDDWVYYGVEIKDFQSLARFIADIERYAKTADWQLDYYRGEEQEDEQQPGADGSSD